MTGVQTCALPIYVADPSSAVTILTQDQPYSNHNGGQIRFGPDGYLYIAMGDGGSGGDPENRSQNLQTLLGKMLRIDVNNGLPYTIPATNPFIANTNPNVKKEIWAYGLRNTWAFSFDRSTGDLFMGDVGQNAWEEIDFQPSSSGGGENYGWRITEGKHCYNPSTGCNMTGLTMPILEYAHAVGCLVTGGFRYRGAQFSTLTGVYFYGDFCTGRIWGATQSGATWASREFLDTSLSISAFGEDEAGELYVVDLDAASGGLYRIKSSTVSGGEIIIDNAPVGVQGGGRSYTGAWCKSVATGFYGVDSLYNCGGADTYRWTPSLPVTGNYDVEVRWTTHPNRGAAVPYKVVHAGGATNVQTNQQQQGGTWVSLGRFNFSAGTSGYVEIGEGDGISNADAVRFVPSTSAATAKLTVSKAGSGSGVVTTIPAGINCGSDCTEDFPVNTVVQVTATPSPGSVFYEWGGPCGGNGTCSITMNDAKFLAATFRVADIILDNAAPGIQDVASGRSFTGSWCRSIGTLPYNGTSLYSCGSGVDTYRWTPKIVAAGGYDVYYWWSVHPNRSATAKLSVKHAAGIATTSVNEQVGGGKWVLIGRYNFSAGMAGYVETDDSQGLVSADAVRLVPAF